MPVTRTYACDECGWEWSHLHLDRSEPFPECPMCATAEPNHVPGGFNINGTKSKAMDIAYGVAEEMGHTDIRDNQRAGDIAAKAPPPVQTAEAESLVMQMKEAAPDMTPQQSEMAKHFWKNPGAGSKQIQTLATAARMQAAATRTAGQDPVALLHEGAKKAGGMKLQVVSRSKG